MTIFFLLLLFEKLGRNTAAPLCHRGVHAMLLLRWFFSTSLTLHRSFSRQRPSMHSSKGIMYEQIHSSRKIIVDWWWNCPLCNAWGMSSIARTQVSLFVSMTIHSCCFAELKFSCLIPILAWLLQFGKLSAEMLCWSSESAAVASAEWIRDPCS